MHAKFHQLSDEALESTCKMQQVRQECIEKKQNLEEALQYWKEYEKEYVNLFSLFSQKGRVSVTMLKSLLEE